MGARGDRWHWGEGQTEPLTTRRLLNEVCGQTLVVARLRLLFSLHYQSLICNFTFFFFFGVHRRYLSSWCESMQLCLKPPIVLWSSLPFLQQTRAGHQMAPLK